MTTLGSIVRNAGVVLALGATVALTGCELYFGDSDDPRTSPCRYDSPDCGRPQPPGFSCETHDECAPGCYCSGDGVCEEAGFCENEDNCPDGFVCDDRSSCVPEECSDQAPCPTGSICDAGSCTETCTCMSDTEAQDQGYGYCDEPTSTCYPGTDPAGTCSGEITCNIVPPDCPQGEVPLRKDGCYTGACRSIAQCGSDTPPCEALDNQVDCGARNTDCLIVSTGLNCTKPDGTACEPGDNDCTCEDFVFRACETKM